MTKKMRPMDIDKCLAGTLADLGARIRGLRQQRGITLARLSEDAGCSELTLIRIEKGAPTVAMGTYARVLHVLGVSDDLNALAAGGNGAGKGRQKQGRRRAVR